MKAEDHKVLWTVAGLFVVSMAVVVPVMYIADSEEAPRARPPAAPKGETNCPLELRELVLDSNKTATCWCNGDFAWTEVAIGTAQYDETSSPCGAAIHAGALSRYGDNRVAFKQTVGCAAYTSSKMNGRESMAWQASPGAEKKPSYIVVGHGVGTCSQSFNF